MGVPRTLASARPTKPPRAGQENRFVGLLCLFLALVCVCVFLGGGVQVPLKVMVEGDAGRAEFDSNTHNLNP